MKWVGITAIVGLLAIGLAFGIPAMLGDSSTAEFSAYGSEWNGAEDARLAIQDEGYQVGNIGSSPIILTDVNPKDTIVFVFGMDLPYGLREMDALDSFLTDGGSVVILDDYGYGNEFTERHGIGYKKRALVDEQFDRNQSFVRVNAQFESKAYPVLLNGAVVLEDVAGNATTKVILRSSDKSYLDLNEKDGIDVADTIGPFVVGLQKPIGVEGGQLIVIADSALFLQDMIHRAQNLDFLLAVVDSAVSEDGLVLFDESRRPASGPEATAYAASKGLLNLLRALPITGILFMVGAFGALLLAMNQLKTMPSWVHRFSPGKAVPKDVPESRKQLVSQLLASHYDMNGGQLDDNVLMQAYHDRDHIRNSDVDELLERIANSLSLTNDQWQAPGEPEGGTE